MAKKLFELDRNIPHVMAVLNVTPDSFSDGGNYFVQQKVDVGLCCQRVEQMLAEGASIIDIGGESTRPGAKPVSTQEEMDRVLPVIEAIKDFDVVISLDSSSPVVMLEAARLGIGLINDIRALQREGAMQVAANSQLPVCLMHMQGQPETMQERPEYRNIVTDVGNFFSERIESCLKAGIKKDNLLIDPGFGFGKTLEHNLKLLAGLSQFGMLGLPILAGLSRKSMVSQLLGNKPVEQRLAGSLALAVMAIERGVWIVRAHDVQETVDAVKIASAIMRVKND
jgi:dihydropteroate synthase